MKSIELQKDRIIVLTPLWVTIFIFPWMIDSINISKLLILVTGVTLAVFYIFKDLDFKRVILEKKLIFALVVSAIFLMFMSAIINPQNFYSDLIGEWRRNNGLISFTATMLLFLCSALFPSKNRGILIIRILTWLGIFFGFYAWLQIKSNDPLNLMFPWYNTNSVLALTLGNTNFASVFLGLLFTASIGYFFFLKNNKWLRIIVFISICNIWILVRYIDTQGKIIYALGASIVVAIWLLSVPKFRAIGLLWSLFASVIGSLGISGLYGLGPFSGMLANNVTNLKDRYFHWLAGIEMMRDHPLFGVGIDAFGQYHREYRLLESIDLRGTAATSTDNAHNVFIQMGATVGLPFLVVYIALVLYVTYRGILALKVSKQKIVVGTLNAIWIGYVIQNLISIDQLGIAVWGWLIGGTLVSESYSKNDDSNNNLERNIISSKKFPNNSRKTNSGKKIGLKLKVFVFFLLSQVILVAPSAYNDFIVFRNWEKLGNSTNIKDAEETAIRLLEVTLNSNQPKLRNYITNTLGQSGFVEEALKLSELTSRRFPRDFESWNIVASIHEANRRPDLAIPARKKTIELDPLNSNLSQLLQEDSRFSLDTP